MLRPADSRLGAERPGFGFVKREIAVEPLNSDAIDFPCFLQTHVAVADVVEDALGSALDWTAETAAAGRFQAERFSRMKDVIGIARGNDPFVRPAGIQRTVAGLAIHAAVDTLGSDCVFGRAQGKTRVVVEDLVLADKSQ